MSYHFAADTDLMYLSRPVLSATGLTMAVWYRGADSSAERSLLCVGEDAASDNQWRILITNTNKYPTFRARANGLNGSAEATVAVTPDTWQHFCGTEISTSERYLYVGGSLSATDTTTRNVLGFAALGNTSVGCRVFSNTGAVGRVAHPAIWDVVLTTQEIALLAAGAKPDTIRPGNLVFYKPLVDGHAPLTTSGAPELLYGDDPIAKDKRVPTIGIRRPLNYQPQFAALRNPEWRISNPNYVRIWMPHTGELQEFQPTVDVTARTWHANGGIGTKFVGSDTERLTFASPSGFTSGEITLICQWWAVPGWDPTTKATLAGIWGSGSHVGCFLGVENDGLIYATATDANNFVSSGGIAVDDNVVYTAVGRFAPSGTYAGQDLWVNGIRASHGSTTRNPLNFATWTMGLYSPGIGTKGSPLTGGISLSVLIPSAKSDDYCQRLSENPWQIFQAPSPRKIFLPPNTARPARIRKLPPVGTSRYFNGVDSSMTWDGTLPVSAYPFSMACWAKRIQQGLTHALMVLVDASADNTWALLYVDNIESTANARFEVRNGASGEAQTTNATNYDGVQWDHVVAVAVSSTERHVYLNGGNKASDTITVNFNALWDRISLGRNMRLSPRNEMYGNIALPAIWNVALSDEDVSALAQGALPLEINRAGLVFYIDDMAGAKDIIGGKTMTINNATPPSIDSPHLIRRSSKRTYFLPPATASELAPAKLKARITRLQQPQTAARVNWSNSLTQGLVEAYVLGVGNDGPVNVVTGFRGGIDNGSPTTIGDRTWFVKANQDRLKGQEIAGGNAITVAVLAAPDGYTTAEVQNAHIFSDHPGWFLSGLNASNHMRFAVSCSTAEVSTEIELFSNLVARKEYLFAGTYDGAFVKTYLDGNYKNQTAQTGTIDAGDGGGSCIGHYWGGGAIYALKGSIRLCLRWNRALTNDEHLLLSSNPWQVFIPDFTRYVFVEAPAAATGLAPLEPAIWVRRVARMVGAAE